MGVGRLTKDGGINNDRLWGARRHGLTHTTPLLAGRRNRSRVLSSARRGSRAAVHPSGMSVCACRGPRSRRARAAVRRTSAQWSPALAGESGLDFRDTSRATSAGGGEITSPRTGGHTLERSGEIRIGRRGRHDVDRRHAAARRPQPVRGSRAHGYRLNSTSKVKLTSVELSPPYKGGTAVGVGALDWTIDLGTEATPVGNGSLS